MLHTELPVYRDTYQLALKIVDYVREFPREYKYALGKEGYGLPIGNLTSQVFANFYLNVFDHYVKHDLRVRYYRRYVDDFILVHEDKMHLKSLIPKIARFLYDELSLDLHPRKIYLQHFVGLLSS